MHGSQAKQASDSAYKAAVDTKDAVSQKMSEASQAAGETKDSAAQKASETYDAAADKAGQVRWILATVMFRFLFTSCAGSGCSIRCCGPRAIGLPVNM